MFVCAVNHDLHYAYDSFIHWLKSTPLYHLSFQCLSHGIHSRNTGWYIHFLKLNRKKVPLVSVFDHLVHSLWNIWVGLEDVALLEKACHWRKVLKFQKPSHWPLVLSDSWFWINIWVLCYCCRTISACFPSALISPGKQYNVFLKV